jgi:hypothetical protein
MSEQLLTKSFNQLTQKERDSAVSMCTDDLMTQIVNGAIRFYDEKNANANDLQQRIDAAIDKSERMDTPWFAHEYIMDTCKDDILAMARRNAEDMLYVVGNISVARVLEDETVTHV